MNSHAKITEMIAKEVYARVRAGDRTPELDTLRIDLMRSQGYTLNEAEKLIVGRLDPVLRYLREEHGLVGTRITAYYVATYKDQEPDHPGTDDEVRLSVAGLSRGTLTAGLHFCDSGDNCSLAIGRAIHGFQSGNGATNAETLRVTTEVGNGTLTMEEGVVKIAVAAPVRAQPSLAKRVQSNQPAVGPGTPEKLEES